MATNILTTGSTAATSSDVVVAASSTLVVALKGGDGKSFVQITMKDDGGAYNGIGYLRGSAPSALLGAGTYQFVRTVQSSSCGVFSG